MNESHPVSILWWFCLHSLVPRPHTPPGKKRSGEQSQISWAYYPKVVTTNEIARLVIMTYTFLTTVKFVHFHLSINTFLSRFGHRMFWSLLGYIVAKVCASPRNSTWFTRPFLLARGWGLGTRLLVTISYFSGGWEMVWLDRLLWVLGQGRVTCVNCLFSIQPQCLHSLQPVA